MTGSTNFGSDRLSRFHVYWIQTEKQTPKQTPRQAKYINRLETSNF